ncbi:unnamed protein product [Owenia fusiformis]|uniref:tRNA wybutosine-synthesizing protein 5 n=1 Tax=Owenia fusiformis TaxID=6347 RepID=A0A8S4P4Y8_OWEFU|nr:unnamed protein product [Owenia fusiformis]
MEQNRISSKMVQIYSNVDRNSFLAEIYVKRYPAVLKGIPIGECLTKWTPEYLASVGQQRKVTVHVSPFKQMDFINKNFSYKTLAFDEFIKRSTEEKHTDFFFQDDERYYLRSLGDDPRKDIADIKRQFPELAEDLKIPHFFEAEQFFSSVFRVSSFGMQLWTHYDVMDNMLIQIKGRKRVVLFSPRDATYLYLNGDKSEVLDIDKPDLEKYPEFCKATRYECVLEPGDILFIPALWFHNVISLDYGIAVNVFWKHLDNSCYDSKDTYGNKDPVVATRAIQKLDNALKLLKDLPDDYRDFYARRMVSRIQNKAYSKEKVSESDTSKDGSCSPGDCNKIDTGCKIVTCSEDTCNDICGKGDTCLKSLRSEDT